MAFQSFRDGVSRVLGAPALIAGVFVATLLTAAPLAIAVQQAIETHFGTSMVAAGAAEHVDYDWWQEFLSQASGVSATLSPAVIGFAATLDSVSGIVDARGRELPVAMALTIYLLVWTFLAGGILDRYARRRATRAAGFFAASGVFFWRFVRLGIVAAAVYWWLYAYIHSWLLGDAYRWLTSEVASERVAFAWRVVLYATFAVPLLAVNITLDYARIRLVVEDRRSALGALSAALSFLVRHGGRATRLYALNSAVFLLIVAVWAVAAPGAGGSGWSIWAGAVAAQLYVLARLAVKLQFMASQTALFQALLAHAGYTSAPAPVWPESPAADAIR